MLLNFTAELSGLSGAFLNRLAYWFSDYNESFRDCSNDLDVYSYPRGMSTGRTLDTDPTASDTCRSIGYSLI